MKLIVWLGNPWAQYANTRHNAGWIVLDYLQDSAQWTSFLPQKKFDGDVAQGLREKRHTLALKPSTYMNKSGQSVQKTLSFYKIPPEEMLVIHDDLDLPFWTIKLKFNGGHGGQNGIRDIIEKIGTARFRRLKIGIWRPENPQVDVVDRVLSSLSPEELRKIIEQKNEITLRIGQFFRNTW